jgi:bile acid:Na+ symporter, BASS family
VRVSAGVASLADRIAVLAVAASALALLAPSLTLARHSDLLLAALVALTALGIEPAALSGALRRYRRVAGLAVGPFVGLAAVGVLGHLLLGGPAGDGVLALGLSSSEVATVGLVGLAGGDAALALGVLVSSLVLAAVLGPLLAPVLAGAHHGAAAGPLLGRFALVVLVPLVAGLAVRAAGERRRITVDQGLLDGGGAIVVSLLVYAALSGVSGGAGLGSAVLGAAGFLIAGGLVGAVAAAGLRGREHPSTVAFPAGLRDFAVAAALAQQAFGTRAAAVAGIYGALMLVAGAGGVTVLRSRSAHAAR